MKRISTISLYILVLFSCGKEKNPTPIATAVPSRVGFADSSEKPGFNPSNDLEIQIPMSNEQLKKWIPEKVGEMEQRKLIIGHKQGMGMGGAIATYHEKELEGKQISMEVLDGAGPTGSVMLKSIHQKLMVDYYEQLNSGYSRIYEREGTRVWEKLSDEEHLVEIEFVLKCRYHFIFKGHGVDVKELWSFVRQVQKEMS